MKSTRQDGSKPAVLIKREPTANAEMLNELANAQSVMHGIIKEYMRMEDELLRKLFQAATGEEITPETMQAQASRMSMVTIEGEFEYYWVYIDQRYLGKVTRNYAGGSIDFDPNAEEFRPRT